MQEATRALAHISSRQNGPFLVFPAQFGRRFKQFKPKEARRSIGKREFCLGAFAIGCMLITHQERLSSDNHLWIDCPGDEYSPEPSMHHYKVPFFGLANSLLNFDFCANDIGGTQSGSATAFVP